MAGNHYILLVEDSKTQAGQIEAVVRGAGYETSVAMSGPEALDSISRRKPSLVISDILMPGMDGYKLCGEIKANPATRDVMVLLLTQLSDPRETIRGLEAGADDFLVKPYADELLVGRIRSLMEARASSGGGLSGTPDILLVEDSPTQAERIRYFLEGRGYSVAVARDGREGLEAARRMKPSLVITDVIMPEMDGYELSHRIKHDPVLKSTPVLLITLQADRKGGSSRAGVAADGYFTKPLDDAHLLDKIGMLLKPEPPDGRIEVVFEGERYSISAGRRQILNFFLSIYESAVEQNREILTAQKELRLANELLEERVLDRTRELKASEEKYRTLLEKNADAVVVIGADGRLHFTNAAARRLFDGGGRRAPELSELIRAQGDVWVAGADGTGSVAEVRCVETTWEGEKAYIATLRDVTERQSMERALRESEESFRALVENANDGIFIIECGGRIVYANHHAAEMTGYPAEELAGMGFNAVADGEEAMEALKSLRDLCVDRGTGVRMESRILSRGGGVFHVEFTASRTKWRAEDAVIFIFRDVTEKRRVAAELARAGKLESIATLAGGIAHDFNNLLTGIIGNISLAKFMVAGNEKAEKLIGEVEKASLRARALTHQLLTFAKGGAPVKKTVSAAAVVTEAASFVMRGSHVGCRFNIPDGLWGIEADEGQIGQVVHNIVLNAVQAMPGGGAIEVSAANLSVGAGDALRVAPGPYVRLTFTDNGPGIPEANLSRIFDPYFTTKKDGTGLGLSTVYSIVKNHGGAIKVESHAGGGTTFHVYLPASSGAQRAVRDVAAEEAGMVKGSGRVLVMDDEEMVRDVAGEILQQSGYEVGFARDGREAVDAYRAAREAGRPFDAVIMDLTIPGGVGGREAVRELLALDPSARVVVSSGYAEGDVMSEYARYGFKAVIAKPYKATDLARVVSEVLKG